MLTPLQTKCSSVQKQPQEERKHWSNSRFPTEHFGWKMAAGTASLQEMDEEFLTQL